MRLIIYVARIGFEAKYESRNVSPEKFLASRILFKSSGR